MASLAVRLPGRGRRGFPELAAWAASRLDVVVVFLALLELYKQGLVDLYQAATFGALAAEWAGPADGSLPDWTAAAAWDVPITEGEDG